MQSVLQQVRNQIRSQVGSKPPKSGMLELVQRVKDREMEGAQASGEPEGKKENRRDEMSTNESRDEVNRKEDEQRATYEEKLEATKKTLREEFEQQISQVRKDMLSYTDRALKDLECKLQGRQSHSPQPTHPREEQEGKGPNRKQKRPAVAALASRRGRVLTRTNTTIIPKTCAPVIICPRATSDTTLTYSKGVRAQLLPRDLALSLQGNKPCQSRRPLPPACPQLHQCKKPVWGRAKTGN
ncbi:putative uncharacterized protein LOC103470604 [Scophthalmus maximus]|nr:putative uncharacterized protein LOC103470604 [Scophthalmus maximus]